jgi:hypothetical protein
MKRIQFLVIMLVFLSVSVFSADPKKARIVTFKSNVVDCLAAISITQIDGQNRMLPTMGFDIEPGEHSMHGRSTVDLRCSKPVRSESRKPVHVPPLEWFFEAGKVYYVGLDYSSPMRENWRVVVWKVEYEDGEVIFDITKKDTTQLSQP